MSRAFVFLLLLAACTRRDDSIGGIIDEQAEVRAFTEQIASETVFYQEPRSKLCFAVVPLVGYRIAHKRPPKKEYSVAGLTEVPCEKVASYLYNRIDTP